MKGGGRGRRGEAKRGRALWHSRETVRGRWTKKAAVDGLRGASSTHHCSDQHCPPVRARPQHVIPWVMGVRRRMGLGGAVLGQLLAAIAVWIGCCVTSAVACTPLHLFRRHHGARRSEGFHSTRTGMTTHERKVWPDHRLWSSIPSNQITFRYLFEISDWPGHFA